MSYCSDIVIGDLVCVKSWCTEDSESGWISVPNDFGIIIGIIEVEYEFVFIDHKNRCYDYVVYWIASQKIETLPDIVLGKYADWLKGNL